MGAEDHCPYGSLDDPRRAAWLEGFRARAGTPLVGVHPSMTDRWVALEDDEVPELRGVPLVGMGVHREMVVNEEANARVLVISAIDGTHLCFEVVGPAQAFR